MEQDIIIQGVSSSFGGNEGVIEQDVVRITNVIKVWKVAGK